MALEQKDVLTPTTVVPSKFSPGPTPIELKPTPLYAVPPIDTRHAKVVGRAPKLLNPNRAEPVGYAIF